MELEFPTIAALQAAPRFGHCRLRASAVSLLKPAALLGINATHLAGGTSSEVFVVEPEGRAPA